MQGYKITAKLVQDDNNSEPVTLFDLLNALREIVILYRWSISDADLWPYPTYVNLSSG